MPRKYDTVLLTNMQAGQRETVYQGVPVLLKPIPEGGGPGDMDPRLYKSMRLMPLLSRFMPKPKKDATVLETVQPLRKMFAEYKGDYIADEGVSTEHVTVVSADGYAVPVRIYKRENAGTGLPIFVYFHGGGFFGGGPDIVEQMCKLLVQKLDCVALNVDYRLCPEHHYPQPLDDCWAATRWAFENAVSLGADPAKLAVGGDSAGGNLAAAVTLRDREEGTNMVRLQALLYPAVNLTGKPTGFYQGVDLTKYRTSKRHKKVLDCVLKMMTGMLSDPGLLDNVYLQGNLSPEHIYASPLLDDFHDLPATLLIFGEHDMLAFEDFAYAQTAVQAGVPIRTVIYEGISHGFADQIGVMPQAEDAIQEIADEMRAVL
ncbi:MAG: alpha/beta hydrolase [Oscillospiraceae bacterium]